MSQQPFKHIVNSIAYLGTQPFLNSVYDDARIHLIAIAANMQEDEKETDIEKYRSVFNLLVCEIRCQQSLQNKEGLHLTEGGAFKLAQCMKIAWSVALLEPLPLTEPLVRQINELTENSELIFGDSVVNVFKLLQRLGFNEFDIARMAIMHSIVPTINKIKGKLTHKYIFANTAHVAKDAADLTLTDYETCLRHSLLFAPGKPTGKGIACRVRKDSELPRTEAGEVAEVAVLSSPCPRKF